MDGRMCIRRRYRVPLQFPRTKMPKEHRKHRKHRHRSTTRKWIELAKQSPNGLLEDPEFKPSNAILFGNKPPPNGLGNIEWKRPSEMTSLRPALFVDGAEEGDVMQGKRTSEESKQRGETKKVSKVDGIGL